jgi:hypothetical protein
MIRTLGLGDDELAADQLEGLSLEHTELDQPIVLGALPATSRERNLAHEVSVVARRWLVNAARRIRHTVDIRSETTGSAVVRPR